jgi:ADP-ribosylglycohydrolase
MMPVPADYDERVYAGVLGKIIGVYVGRPIEGWSHDRIVTQFGEITGYVNDALGVPLVVSDDDISGTFAFLRAIEDYGPDLTAAQIGEHWLSQIAEEHTILWWGGIGISTEHTAFLRLKHGIQAPESGSIARNGQRIAEQIGAQIFIDGWGLINPNDPSRAASYARLAASVSHDGEAIYGAQVIAAMVAAAFGEPDTQKLIEIAVKEISPDSLIARLIADVREWHASGLDWREGFRKIEANYGYEKYDGGCHIVPNHALIIHALLHSAGDFHQAIKIVNTCGWDTDCNSGNVGCILGVQGGLATFDAGTDWRGPVADRLFIAAAEGGRTVTDALSVATWIGGLGRKLRNEGAHPPNDGAKYHFSQPGSVQGFRGPHAVQLQNFDGSGLQIVFTHLEDACPIHVLTDTFLSPEALKMPGYSLMACPNLYSGQRLSAEIHNHLDTASSVEVALAITVYDEDNQLGTCLGRWVTIESGKRATLEWDVPDTNGFPIAAVGIAINGAPGTSGSVLLTWLTWVGDPNVSLRSHATEASARSWFVGTRAPEPWMQRRIHAVQNEGRSIMYQGGRDWANYRAEAEVTIRIAEAAGLAVRIQGLRRYYALELTRDQSLQLIKVDHEPRSLAATKFEWELNLGNTLALEVNGNLLRASIDGNVMFEVRDEQNPFLTGGVGLSVDTGCISAPNIAVTPILP